MTQQQSGNQKQKQALKKYLVFAIMIIVFLGCLWLIFAPSAADKEAEKHGVGFNSTIPDPKDGGIVGDKKTAYEQEQIRLRQEERMNSLQDYAYMLGDENETEEERAAREERQLRMAPKPIEYYEDPERFEGGYSSGRSGGAFRSSASAHADISRTLGNFYEEPETDPETEELKAEVERLNAQLAEQQSAQMSMDDQLALMERSYQLAAKYTGGQHSGSAPDNTAAAVKADGKSIAMPVTQVRRSVVSSLSAPMSDAEFVRQFSGERNRGFNTVGGNEDATVEKNTIAAVVHGDQVLVNGQSVKLRMIEPMRVGRIVIPRNTILTGSCGIGGKRLEVAVSSIEYEGSILAVKLTVYDSDGQQGIYIPGSMEIEAFKEIAGNMGSGLGSTINLNQQSAGEQLLTDMGRGVIQGTSQYISKKARQVKVTLKAGYRLFLLPETNS